MAGAEDLRVDGVVHQGGYGGVITGEELENVAPGIEEGFGVGVVGDFSASVAYGRL